MKLEILFLKIAVFIMGAAVLAMCIFGLPSLANDVANYYPAYLLYPFMIGAYAGAVPVILALYHVFRFFWCIGKESAFSELSVKALRNTKNCFIAISIICAAIQPFLYFIAQFEDAPGILAIGLAFTFVAIVIALFASLLQKLFQNSMYKKD